MAHAVLGLIHAQKAEAAESTIALDYSTSAEAAACGDAADMRARIAARLGRDPFSEDGSAGGVLRIRVQRAHKRRYSAVITLVDAQGQARGSRTLEEPSAEALGTSVAFTVAVLIEDLPTMTGVAAQSSPPQPSVVVPPPEEAQAPPPPAAKESSSQLRIDAALGGSLSPWSAPAPAAGVDATLGADFGASRARIELSGRVYLPASSDADVSVRTRLIFARLAPCYGMPLLSGCLALAGGSVSGEAVGARVTNPQPTSAFFAAGGCGIVSRLFVSERFFARAALEVWFPLARTSFDVGPERAFTLPAALGMGTLGVGARLP